MLETTIPLPWFDIIILLVVGILELIFTIYLFVRYERSPAITAFSFLSLCVTGWVLTNGIGLFFARGGFAEDITYRFSFIFAMFLFSTLYIFVLLFPYPKLQIDGRRLLFMLMPSAILTPFIIWSHAFVVGFKPTSSANTIFGNDYWIYSVYIIFMFFLAMIEIINRIKQLEGIQKWRMRVIYYALLFSGIIGFSNHLILPYIFQIDASASLGPGSSVIWLGSMWYIIKKKI